MAHDGIGVGSEQGFESLLCRGFVSGLAVQCSKQQIGLGDVRGALDDFLIVKGGFVAGAHALESSGEDGSTEIVIGISFDRGSRMGQSSFELATADQEVRETCMNPGLLGVQPGGLLEG